MEGGVMEANWLQISWYILFVVLLVGYAILDGFDLGIGVLSLVNRSDKERRLYVNAVAPVWDGNEVWLLTAGGALFAAFPLVYATVFSGFYLALMLVLVGLIARAVSMEFRGKVESARWRLVWDRVFGVGSLLPAFLLGVAVGNILRGLPLSETGEFEGTFLGLLNPFSLLVGLLGLVMFVMHGALYMAVKSTGKLQARMLSTASRSWTTWVLLYICTTVYGFFEAPHLFEKTLDSPWFFTLFFLFMAALLYLPVAISTVKPFRALVVSSLGILGLIGKAAVGLYPTIVPARNAMERSLTITNASSSQTTLFTMLVIALIGMPIVITYTYFIYRVFKGKVELDEYSY
jgi:cytochrome bd ubiquinol oxidase subunit II